MDLKAQGRILLTALNDLKRPVDIAAREMGVEVDFINRVLAGEGDTKDVFSVLDIMSETYPIDPAMFLLREDDTVNGVKFMSAEDSWKSLRILDRPVNVKEPNGERTDYYGYADTVISTNTYYRPEWIDMRRKLDTMDPRDPAIVFNRGHFMHQFGIFVGPVNFHWVDRHNVPHIRAMNTGDSNYITPFIPHSFTTRDTSQQAYIIAVTHGAEVARAQRELYALGAEAIEGFVLPYTNPNAAQTQLIRQFMRNEHLTPSNLEARLKVLDNQHEFDSDLDVGRFMDPDQAFTNDDLEALAVAFNTMPGDITLPIYDPREDVVIKVSSEHTPHGFPNEETLLYKIHTLARTRIRPLLRGSILDVLAREPSLEHPLGNQLHAYVNNFGDVPVSMLWREEDNKHETELEPAGSVYIKPFVEYAFGNPEGGNARLLTVGLGGGMNLQAQREISTYADSRRVINETTKWYN